MPVPRNPLGESQEPRSHLASLAQSSQKADSLSSGSELTSWPGSPSARFRSALPSEVIAGFQRARDWNAIAHDPATSPKTRSFAFYKKSIWVSRVVRAMPDAIDLGDTALLPRGIVAVSIPGVGALHVKLADVYPDVAKVIVDKMMTALNVRLIVTPAPRRTRELRRQPTAAA